MAGWPWSFFVDLNSEVTACPELVEVDSDYSKSFDLCKSVGRGPTGVELKQNLNVKVDRNMGDKNIGERRGKKLGVKNE